MPTSSDVRDGEVGVMEFGLKAVVGSEAIDDATIKNPATKAIVPTVIYCRNEATEPMCVSLKIIIVVR